MSDEGEEYADEDGCPFDFRCMICLDLLCQPVVLGCGDAFCFRCFFHDMRTHEHNKKITHDCPACKHQYRHLPSVCQSFDDLLLKNLSTLYKKRRIEVLVLEKTSGWSPEVHALPTPCVGSSNQSHPCLICKELLVKPIVLNCGHAYCQICLDPAAKGLKCFLCQSLHPGPFPKVCLSFDKLLKREYSEQYSTRYDQLKSQIDTINEKGKEMAKSTVKSPGSPPRVPRRGTGCDSCGVFPIIGKWYRCIDCTHVMGFDLCEKCYRSNSNHSGRFNQHHTREHRMKVVNERKIVKLY